MKKLFISISFITITPYIMLTSLTKINQQRNLLFFQIFLILTNNVTFFLILKTRYSDFHN